MKTNGKLGAVAVKVRAAKRECKPLPYPPQWKSKARSNSSFSLVAWKSLSKSEQTKKMAELRPTQHRRLHLCNSAFPSDFPDAWVALTDLGT